MNSQDLKIPYMASVGLESGLIDRGVKTFERMIEELAGVAMLIDDDKANITACVDHNIEAVWFQHEMAPHAAQLQLLADLVASCENEM